MVEWYKNLIMNNLYSFGCSYSSVNFKNAQYKYRGYPEHKLYNELLAEELNLNLINDDRYIDDKHFSPIGNQKLYEIILNILENE